MKSLLTKRDSLGVLDLIQKCFGCATVDDFRSLFKCLGHLTAYDFAVCGLENMDLSGKVSSYDVVNINYPGEWIDHYMKNNYHLLDPVFKTNFSFYRLQWWADTYLSNTPPKKFICEARDFDLHDGYTFGTKNPRGGTGSLISISGKHMDHSKKACEILHHVAPHFHQALIRVTTRQAARRAVPQDRLSPREREVISWVKQGKGSWEISLILGISQRTVNFHVGTVMRKLDAVSRAQAVAIAVEQGLIGLD